MSLKESPNMESSELKVKGGWTTWNRAILAQGGPSSIPVLVEEASIRRPARAAMFGTWRDLTHFYQISDLLAHFNVSDDVWDGFLHQIGPLGEDVRLLAALPRLAIVAACSNALHGDGSAFVPVDATQVGLVWRMARRVIRSGLVSRRRTSQTRILGLKAPRVPPRHPLRQDLLAVDQESKREFSRCLV